MKLKLIVLGLDALVPNLVERFMNEDILPNFKKLTKNGVFTRIRPVIPAQTPTNWQTIVTGATPGTHSIVIWGTHRENEEVFKTYRGSAFTSGICEGEYIWETLSETGQKTAILNYPGWPPTKKNVVFVDYIADPTHSLIDIAEPTVYHNNPEIDKEFLININPAKNWKNLPFNNKNLFEFQIEIVPTDLEIEKNRLFWSYYSF
ncbi:MAG: alkaline phosphatase family protein [Candidatus Omnitrophica bacterium]|nr:alkaline phosphatase family protein [Candidatus Omnitrophota bacterium]MCM8803430.1 alkaline phosphatase family protein [Candidatus Omnitrophota bacterium]